MGIYRVPKGQLKSKEKVVAAEDVTGIIQQLFIADNKDSTAVWVLTDQKRLYYAYSNASTGADAPGWSLPFLFAKNVLSLASLRSLTRSTNELFVLDDKETLTHHWQDPGTTVWRSQTSAVGGKPQVTNFHSYTTHLHFEQKGSPMIESINVNVTSNELLYCVINNKAFNINATTPAEVSADIMGNITIIGGAVDFAPPILHVQSECLHYCKFLFTNLIV